MSKALVSDALWAVVEPLLPPEPPKPQGGRPRVPDRAALSGIIFVLKSGIPWELLPQEMGCGSGMTCWRRLRDWQRARGAGTAAPDVAAASAGGRETGLVARRAGLSERGGQKGGEATGPNPTDRGKPGSKRHVVVDRAGTPLAVTLTAANVHDSQQLEATLEAIAPVRGKRGRPRRRPAKLHADKAYDSAACRLACRQRGITPRIARKGIESSERLGRHRWVVERTLAWLNRYRPLDRALRATSGHPSGVPDLGLRAHLLASAQPLTVLIDALSQQIWNMAPAGQN